MSVKLNLDSIEKAVKLTNLCHRFGCDVDVKAGRYIVCGASLLGVESMIGREVTVECFGDKNDVMAKRFYKEVEAIA